MAFMSGLFLIVDLQPLWLRRLSIINPLSHGIEWFRVGVYGERYPHNSLDQFYLVEWAVVVFFLGLVIDRSALRALDRA
jgi:ABC-type polysaccharide/polyol phosphate export permease